MLAADNSASNYHGIVIKLDTDGVIQDSFSVINSYKSGNYSYLLYIYKFYMASDNSMLIFAESSYLPNEIGVPNDSSIDLSIFKIDSNKDFVWSTSVDFMHGVDEFPASGYIYEETVYASTSSARNYLWIFTLDYLEGYLQNSRCLYLLNLSNHYREYKVIYASDFFAFAFISRGSGYASHIFIYR